MAYDNDFNLISDCGKLFKRRCIVKTPRHVTKCDLDNQSNEPDPNVTSDSTKTLVHRIWVCFFFKNHI